MSRATCDCVWLLSLMLGVACVACTDAREGTSAALDRRQARVAVGVVSSVDGHPIEIAEVADLARTGQFSPVAALRRLQAERLLAGEAERRGYAQRKATQYASRQALVQALLVQAVEAQEVSETELEQAYTAQKARFERPARRRATHLLAELPKHATPEQTRLALTFMTQALERVRGAPEPLETLHALRQSAPAGLRVSMEDLPPAPAEGAFVPEFSHALFSVAAPGVVPTVVHTQFGYHVIVVSELLPATITPKGEALSTLAHELGERKHKARFDALVLELQGRTRVSYAQKTDTRLTAVEL